MNTKSDNMMPVGIKSTNTPDELLQAYTALFLFLGGSVSMTPGQSDLPHLCDAGFLRNLPLESTNSRFEQASRLLRSPCPLKQQCHAATDKNYISLLGGHQDSEAYPAASRWMKTGISAEDHIREIGNIYKRYGYGLSEESGLEADHLGIQLLFVNLLIEKYLTEDDYEIKAMIGRDLLAFINDEMLSWLPRWAEAVSEKSRTKCYTGISGLITGGLEDVRDIVKNQKLGL